MSRLVLAAPSKARAARPIPTITPYSGKPVTYQQLTGVPLSMAILSQDFTEVMRPVMCKDYISDAIWSETTGRAVDQIYGLTWTPGTTPMAEHTFIGLRFDNEDQAKKSKNIAALLDVWNKALGFQCELIDTTKPCEKILQLDTNWVAQPIRVSLLTLMVRSGIAYRPPETLKSFFNDFGFNEELLWTSKIGQTPKSNRNEDVLSPSDPTMVFRVKDRMLEIAKTGKFPDQTWEQYTTVGEVHAYSGIVCYDPKEEEARNKRNAVLAERRKQYEAVAKNYAIKA